MEYGINIKIAEALHDAGVALSEQGIDVSDLSLDNLGDKIRLIKHLAELPIEEPIIKPEPENPEDEDDEITD